MTIDLIYKNRNMTILVNGEDRKITAIDPCPDNCDYITWWEMINISHLRFFVPDDMVRIKGGRIIFRKTGECMDEAKYIVTKSQILNGVEWAIEQSISNNTIIRELMTVVENEIETILEDDCEKFVEEDWDYIGDCQQQIFKR